MFASILIFSVLYSLPSYSIQENSGCINCHVNPTGGVMRNDYGSNIYSFDELSIRKWITKDDKEFDGFITDNIQIGGEFRIQSYDKEVEQSVFPMQIDFFANIEFNNYSSLFVKYGVDSELYFLFNDMLNIDWIKVGKTTPDYGLKIDDHTSFIRGGNSSKTYVYSGSIDEGLVFDYANTYRDPFLIQFSSKLKKVNIVSSLGSGIIDNGNTNLAINLIYRNNLDFGPMMFGASFMKEEQFNMYGVYGGISKGKITISSELDFANNWISNYTSMAGYYEFLYVPIQGVHLTAKYDYFDKNFDISDGAVERYSFGVNFFPINLVEIKFQLREYNLHSISFKPNTEYLVQLHTWF